MTATVTLQVNQSRLIGNLKHSFTNQSTFLSELMQNARRAGASEVRFEFHAPHTLVVIDNGHGIDNLQNLLTIAESVGTKSCVTKSGLLAWALWRHCLLLIK